MQRHVFANAGGLGLLFHPSLISRSFRSDGIMTVPGGTSVVSRKRRIRRRRQDKPAVSARLVLDDHIKGEVGILSEDLFSDLFPHVSSGMPLFFTYWAFKTLTA